MLTTIMTNEADFADVVFLLAVAAAVIAAIVAFTRNALAEGLAALAVALVALGLLAL